VNRTDADADERRDETPRRRRRKKRRRRTTRHSLAISGYTVGIGFLLLLWATLAWLARDAPHAAIWLGVCGVLTTMAGAFWLYRCAAEDGVERMHFLNLDAPVLTVRLIVLVIEILVMPVFSVVYLLLFFDSAWKPFLIEFLGLAMLATGVLIILHL
jgi:hypothetical protein